MTSDSSKKSTPHKSAPQMRSIKREQIQQQLAFAAVAALLLSGCFQNRSSPAGTRTVRADRNSDEDIPAVFYTTVDDCKADVQKQQREYAVLESAFEAGTLSDAPTLPPLKAEDCGPQMRAAQQAHQQHAPQYASLADCQADGVECEPAASAQTTGYYQPRFGGAYFFPFLGGRTNYIYVNDSGSQRRLYEPRTVYQSATPGQVVTPNGQVITNSKTGVINAPRSTTAAPPQRPRGAAARGTVTGRGSRGFGSTYKGTGRGGK